MKGVYQVVVKKKLLPSENYELNVEMRDPAIHVM